jgi:carbonic anhydrase
MTIQEIISQIVDGNNEFTKSHNKDFFESFKNKQQPFITLVTCSDSRVSMNAIMSDTSNKIFSIQNIGNQVLSNEGSIDYGIYHLKTPLLMFLGHSDCGAIKAYLEGFEKETCGIKHELGFLEPLLSDKTNDIEFEKFHSQVIEKNLDYQVKIACEKYSELISSEALTVVAGFYDFKGEFGKGQGTIVIVNVNGQTDINEIQSLPFFDNVSREQKEIHTGRLPK